jgi:universal stress protein E
VHVARSVGAEIYLFSCDAALAKTLRHSYNTEDAEKAWGICLSEHLAYLSSLRAAIRSPDVRISVDAACYHPLFEGILRKAQEVRADLIMKCPSGAHPMRRISIDASDWQLMRGCPGTLMLVHSRPWQAIPRFAALVDFSGPQTASLAEAIVHTSEYFALGCRGQLDVVYSEVSGDAAERNDRSASLERLMREYHIGAKHVHVLSGDPELTLPDFAGRHQYDALVLGGLTHRKGISAVVGTLTSKLIEALDCDFILVKRTADRGEPLISGEQGTSKPEVPMGETGGPGSSVLWQSLFGD